MADVIIIGGGVAGLSAGIYARLCGFETTIYEAHTKAGGNLTGWQRGGYHIDNCIHWLTGTNPATSTYRMWEELGVLGGVEVFTPNSLYTVRHEGESLSLFSDLDRIQSEMLAVSPSDEREILDLVRAVRLMQGIIGIAGKEQNESLSLGDVLNLPLLLKYYKLSCAELSDRFSHPLLRKFVRAFWGDEFGALAMVCVFANFCGGNGGLVRGGSLAAAERMTARYLSLGGQLKLGARVEKIKLSDKRARSIVLPDGTEISADYVISTADPDTVFGKSLDLPMPNPLVKEYKNNRIHRFSSYQCAIACKSQILPFEGDCIFTVDGSQIILREFSHEGGFAPSGEVILQTMTFCSERECLDFIRLRGIDKAAYDKRKAWMGKRQIALIEKEFPILKGHLSLIDVWTPATYKRYTSSGIGSYMAFTFPSRAFPKKISARVRGASNVFLATQWQQYPGGLPIAAERGREAVLELCRREPKLVSANIKKISACT